MESFAWTFASRFERTKHWYIIAITVIVTAVIVSFLVGEFLLGIVLIMFAGVYLLYDVNTHPDVRVVISDNGLSLNEDVYDYTRIRSFGVIRVDQKPMILRFQTTVKTIGNIDLFIDPVIDLSALRIYLQSHIPEDAEADIGGIERLLLGLRL